MSEEIGANVILLESRVRTLQLELATKSYDETLADLDELRDALRGLNVVVALAELADVSLTKVDEIHLVLDRLRDTLAEIRDQLQR